MNETRQSNSTNASLTREPKRRRRVRTWQVVTLWLICMAPFMSWGLPSSQDDALLFSGEEAWDADRYRATQALQARRERIDGADTDLDPIDDGDHLVELTDNDAARGAILRRYRLYSRQPDEMITFMALQRMDPRRLDFDPRLYQYGGGYIYLIGAALGLSSLLGLTTLTSDAGVYLCQPELFARFYIVARLVTLIFGAFTLVATVKLARRAAGRTAGWVALVLVAASPVFITGVLEAKPHLPSACMLLWALLSALDYQSDGRRRDALRMGLQVGCALSLVLTGLAGALLWPVLLIFRKKDTRGTPRDLASAGVLALATYVVTNPYIPYNLLFNRAALASNIANSTAMYSIDQLSDGLLRVAQLLLESCGPGLLLGGMIALAWMYCRWPRQADLVSVPGLALLALCIAIGAGKPAEFARFLLLPAILLGIGTAVLVVTLASRRPVWSTLVIIVVLAVTRCPAYLHSFYVDARFEQEARHRAAIYLREHAGPTDAIGVVQEPAPYCVPPLDFASRRVLLLPQGGISRLECRKLPRWLVFSADDATVYREAWWQSYYGLSEAFAAGSFGLSRIAWADKPTFVYRRAE